MMGDVPRVISEVWQGYNIKDIENIKEVQKILSELGCLPKASLFKDGPKLYGPATEKAVKKFQVSFMGRLENPPLINNNGKNADGRVDTETAIALDNINPSFLKSKGVNVRS